MGYGQYSAEAHDAILKGRAKLPMQELFAQTSCHPLMNPKGVLVRECRDAPDHPASLGIAFALDVTGSMGDIPKALATVQLPKFMKLLFDCGIADPQVLFLAVGDAYSDRAPLQVGQFESTAELMDQWLTRSFLEGGGGGSGEESYELALYFLAQHTEMDCAVKRKKRGYVFVTGDELPYPTLPSAVTEAVLGDRLDDELKVEEIVAELQKTFCPFFVIPDLARRRRCEQRWRELLGDNVLCLEGPEDTCYVTAGAVALEEGAVADLDRLGAMLTKAGIEKARLAPVLRALTPLADLLGKHGKGGPRVSAAPPSGLRRFFKALGA
ncbi:MAG: VWA domain-containing protein [Myxococcales bacterium]